MYCNTETRLILVLMSFFLMTSMGNAQPGSPEPSRMHLTVGLSYNPFLALMENRQELGPSVAFGYALTKRIETGASLFTRQVIHAPNNDYKQMSNLNSRTNLETLYGVYAGMRFSGKTFTHMVSVVGGFRHDLYDETLVNPQYGINQTYRNSEWNAVYGMGYASQYHLSQKSALSFRLFVPLNRHPFDDVIKYSIEPGFSFKL